jgi:hypothetical protein
VSVQNFIPTVWSRALLTEFRKQFVFGSLVNRNYEGEIRDAGDSVKITTPQAVTVSAYAGSVSYESPTSTSQTLLIDQDQYWAFSLDDVDQAQANVSTMAAYMEESAVALADVVDQDLAGLYTDAGLAPIALDLGTDDFYAAMTVAGQQLDEANVPRTGRWVIVTPKGYADLLTNTNFIHATTSGDSVLMSGVLGSISGFRVMMSNNIVNSGAADFEYLYGTNQAITFAENFVSTEALRLESAFEDGVRGRLVYGRKVVRPNALGVITADET